MINDSNEMTYSYLTHHILNTGILRDISVKSRPKHLPTRTQWTHLSIDLCTHI